MKPPVSIDALIEMWSKDCVIDETEPGKELLRIPTLHSKYLTILTHHNLIVKKIISEYNFRKKLRWEYYAGHLNNPEDLQKYGYEPLLKTIIKQEIPQHLEADAELNTLLLKRAANEEISNFCQSVLKELNSRTYQIRSFMDWEKFIGNQ